MQWKVKANGGEGWGVSTHKSWHKSFKSFWIPSECTIYRHCFHFFLLFQLVSHPVPMHALDRFCYCFFSAVPNCFKHCQNACLRDIVFKRFSEVLNRFKYRHNACFRDFVFYVFSAVSNRFKYCQNTCLRDVFFKRFSEVLNRFKYCHNACFRYIVFYVYSAIPCR